MEYILQTRVRHVQFRLADESMLFKIKQQGNSSFSRIDSLESEKEVQQTSKKNDKKSLFFKYGPIDGNLIYTYGMEAKIEKKYFKSDRRFTILDQQIPLLKSQDIQRRKSAEGSLFGFVNNRITQFDQVAPFHPNYQAPKLKDNNASSFQIELSPQRKVKETQKTRLFNRDYDQNQNGQDGKPLKRASYFNKANIFNTGTLIVNNNTMDEIKTVDKIQCNATQTVKGGSIIKLNQNLLALETLYQQQLQQILQRENSGEKSPENNQTSIAENTNQQKIKNSIQEESVDKILTKKNTNKLDSHPSNDKNSSPNNNRNNQNNQNSNNYNNNNKNMNIKNKIVSKNRRTNTQTDLTEFLNNKSESDIKLKTKAKFNESINSNDHLSPPNNAFYFNVHTKNTNSQTIQKYVTTAGENTSNGNIALQQQNKQSSQLIQKQEDNGQARKEIFGQMKKNITLKHSFKPEKLAPIQFSETTKSKSKTSQYLFSQVYIKHNPLYKKMAEKGRKVTLPDISSNKNANSTQKQITDQDISNTREPLSLKVQEDQNQSSKEIDKQQKQFKEQEEIRQKQHKINEIQFKSESKTTQENSENRIIFRKQTLKQSKKSLLLKDNTTTPKMNQFSK